MNEVKGLRMSNDEARDRRARAWALGTGALAIAIYVGFILLKFLD